MKISELKTRYDSLRDIAEYPRPQLRRDNWQSLNGSWQFSYDDDHKCHKPEDVRDWSKNIEVPFAPESQLSGIGDTGFHQYCWYQRNFRTLLKPGERTILHFGAVDYSSKVWVNGKLVGSHIGGHSSFSFDITDALNPSTEDQRIAVLAEDDPKDLAKPRGKQDWKLECHSIWYHRTTGIWQTVWIERVPEIHVAQIRWAPHLQRWELGCEVFLKGHCCEDLKLKLKLSCRGHVLAEDTYLVVNNEVHRRIALSDPGIDDYRNELLWSPEKPTLIDAELELIGKENGREEVIDKVHSYVGLRSVDIQRDRFLLNGRPYYLRLVLDQGYWPDSLMTPPSLDALASDIFLTKEMGFNGVRKHQKIEDPRYLFLADNLGLIVWEEMPSCYRFTEKSVERLTCEWIEVINRDANHPCIAVWVPFNESWGVPDLAEKKSHQSCVQALYHLTKTLDPSRPVLANDGWESPHTDILGIHDYDEFPERLHNRYGPRSNIEEILVRRRPAGRILTLEDHPHQGQPVMLTEFGGIAFISGKKVKNSWGYATSASKADFLSHFSALLKAVNSIEHFSGFCYTQLTDTFQEANGLLDSNRHPKLSIQDIYRVVRGSDLQRDLLDAPPTTHAADEIPVEV